MQIKALILAQSAAVMASVQWSYTGTCAGTSGPINWWLPDGTQCGIFPFTLTEAQTIGTVTYTTGCCNWFTDSVGECSYNTRALSDMNTKATCLDGSSMGTCASFAITQNVDHSNSPLASTC